ncbi:unnamed protein product [Fraxinus pennsylvanica]|uniref:Uncharacterized protein n=1 Tax=Fraxinus pennsylvanica TaxID=56036 RepID=A0AAD1ZH47_9LAMI|nr:unnamed protein product [Fraxinus pennsylvanica]
MVKQQIQAFEEAQEMKSCPVMEAKNYVMRDGLFTRGRILRKCRYITLFNSEFKGHAGSGLKQNCLDHFMETGKTLPSCQLEAWSAEYNARKVATQNRSVDEIYEQNLEEKRWYASEI